MIISLPMTSNTTQIFSSLLFKWKAELDNEQEEFKQIQLKDLRKSWWNRTFRSKTTDQQLINDSSLHWNMDYQSISWRWHHRIEQLTSLLSAHKLAALTETAATYDIPDHLIHYLNSELAKGEKNVS